MKSMRIDECDSRAATVPGPMTRINGVVPDDSWHLVSTSCSLSSDYTPQMLHRGNNTLLPHNVTTLAGVGLLGAKP